MYFPRRICSEECKYDPISRNVMATIFWDLKGIILMNFLEKGRTIMAQYYSELLDRFNVKLKGTWPHLAKIKCSFTTTMH